MSNTNAAYEHDDYLSTACFHGHHDYCAAMTGYQGEKRPAKCKFCDAWCICTCHTHQHGTTTEGLAP